jgi:hypothetical protein
MTLSSTLGILAGIMAIEHGIGEVLEGYRPTESVFILSWPNSAFFEIMSGEPAMTVIPNYLVTGLLAILFSSIFLVLFVKSSHERKTLHLTHGTGCLQSSTVFLVCYSPGHSACA